ncbi:MAG: hypothetical protein E6G73_10335 [Alphaproteobacteria bacterium]|nr:MAG: hypothetical protein E6G73_10335 [Alphaproteobacteria bacterium]
MAIDPPGGGPFPGGASGLGTKFALKVWTLAAKATGELQLTVLTVNGGGDAGGATTGAQASAVATRMPAQRRRALRIIKVLPR